MTPSRAIAYRLSRTFVRAAWIAVLSGAISMWGLGTPERVVFAKEAGAFPIVADGRATNLVCDAKEFPGVIRVVRDFQADIQRVTGRSANYLSELSPAAGEVVLVGTLGRHGLIDELVAKGKLEVGSIAGKWESHVIEVIENPFPGVTRALVVAGSDKRGTIYGVYTLSEQMGVSPWYWWADVPATHHDEVFIKSGRFERGPPSVKYRGIFLNDEAPDLTNWVRAKFGSATVRSEPPVPEGIANYNHEFYARIFEVLLRLRGNYLWPAMWNNAFNEDDPENAPLADEYGIVMGTSHQEPMIRAQKEWDRRYQKTIGTWNYSKDPDVLENFWREGVRRNRNFESIVTLGLRGANDTEMAPGGPDANRALLEKIVDRQREILRQEVNPDLTAIPQMWCLYKEVQDYYDAGMRVPDDVTLLWAEDNWGNIRRLPTPAERTRSGGAGVYYHFDYHGGPRSYQWLNTSPLPNIWEQMSLAKQYGADRIWIVNVGHFKGYELPTEFFLSLGWDASRWTAENIGEFTRSWAAREFGAEHATEIADIMARYAKYNGRRKPELLAPDTYSLVNYNEAERVVADFDEITAKAEALFAAMPAERRDAFYQLVLFPTKASALVNHIYFAAGRNALYAKQGRASAAPLAAEVRRLFHQDLDLMTEYNTTFADGRWAHFMDQTHLGYTTWRDPPKNSLDAIKLVEPVAPAAAALGVAVEGSEEAWPGPTKSPTLPTFDSLTRASRFIDVFNRGTTPFEFSVTSPNAWVRLEKTSGTLGSDQRVRVEVAWSKAPVGRSPGRVVISGAGETVTVELEAVRVDDVTPKTLSGFAESAGVVAIEPEHATRLVDVGASRWRKLPDYGRTLGGLRAEGDANVHASEPAKNAPCAEYRIYLFGSGEVEVTAITAPTLNFVPGRGLRYAASFDDEPPQTVEIIPAHYKAQNGNRAWEKSVSDNAHTATSHHVINRPGYHVLKIWMLDPAVVLQKLIVDRGGKRPSYLGPPESFRR